MALGDVVAVRSSLVDPTEEKFRDFPHIAPDTIERETGRLLRYATIGESGVQSGKYRFEAGDVLYSKIRPNLNKATLVDFDGLCSADMYALQVDSSQMSASFLGHLLRSPGFVGYATNLSGRANIPKLNRSQLLRFQFDLPALQDQRRIATMLEHADGVRRRQRDRLRAFGELKRAIFASMFAAISSTATLGEYGEVQGGLQVSRKRDALPLERPYLRVANVYRGALDLGEIKIIRVTEAELIRVRLEPGDMLFVEGNANPNEVGRVALWDGSVPDCLHQNHLIRVRLDRAKVEPVYAEAWFNSREGSMYFQRAGKTTSGLNTINASQVRAAPLPVPPVRLQREYVGLTSAIDSNMKKQDVQIELVDEVFTALQARAFSGQL